MIDVDTVWKRLFQDKWHRFLQSQCPSCRLIIVVRTVKVTQTLVVWPCPFFIHHRTTKGNGTVLAVQHQYLLLILEVVKSLNKS